MIVEGILQFLAAGIGTVAFSVLFSVPREHYPLCGFIGGTGWLICWTFVHGMGAGAIVGNFVATVFITLASRIGSTVRSLQNRKCPADCKPLLLVGVDCLLILLENFQIIFLNALFPQFSRCKGKEIGKDFLPTVFRNYSGSDVKDGSLSVVDAAGVDHEPNQAIVIEGTIG